MDNIHCCLDNSESKSYNFKRNSTLKCPNTLAFGFTSSTLFCSPMYIHFKNAFVFSLSLKGVMGKIFLGSQPPGLNMFGFFNLNSIVFLILFP